MNASEFEIPVAKQYYDNVGVGTKLSDEFKMGSLIMTGSWGNLVIEVINKDIRFNG